jgi:predicted alpha/beta superfamily hydrolase
MRIPDSLRLASLVLVAAGCSKNAAGVGAAPVPPDSSAPPPACVRDRAAPAGITVSAPSPRFTVIEGFPSLHLGNTRALRVRLPAGYAGGAASYPVLYMHDGQNLFDGADASFGREWQVDETTDRLVAEGRIPEVIVVGIDSTPARIDEYTPTEAEGFTGPNGERGGKGPLYTRFLVEEVKPYIDSHYRTRCGPESSAVLGSSLGGLISLDIGWRHPEVFGRVGALSPSFWWNQRDTLARLQQAGESAMPRSRVWIDAGTREENDDRDDDGLIDMVDDAREVRDRLLALGHGFGDTLGGLEVKDALHDEASWAERFGDLLIFLFGSQEPAIVALAVVPFGDRLALQGPARRQVLHTTVIATYDSGMRMTVPGSLVAFELADPALATVDASGAIHGIATGTTTVQATYGGLRAPPVSFEVVDEVPETVTITFEVTVPAGTPAGRTVTLAGTMNGWQPSLDSYALQKVDDTLWTGAFAFPYEDGLVFKPTLQPQDGDPWHMVEKDADCEETAGHALVAGSDRTHPVTVHNWRNVPPCGD